MVELIFVRHGQTDWNLSGRLQGILDIPLNDSGINEAKELRENLKIDVKSIISSPLKRAYKTAEILNEKLNLPITADKRLQERNFGSLAGEKASFFKTMVNGDYEEDLGVESIKTFGEKLLDFLKSCEILEHGKYLVATHGGVIITLLNILSHGELNWENTPIQNCTITSLKFEDKWIIDYYNRVS